MKFQARNNYLINWPEYPLLRITICFIIGIALSDFFTLSLGSCIVILISLLITYIFLNGNCFPSKIVIRLLSSLVLLIGISLGVFRANLQKGSNNTFNFLNHIGNENLIVGRVATDLKRKKRVSTTLQVLRVDGEPSRGKLLVYFSKRDSLPEYQIGDIIFIEGKVQLLKDNSNPKSFNYKDYLRYKSIDSQIFLRDDKHKLLSKGELNYINQTALRIRKRALSIFEKRLKDKDHLAVASAMVLGYRDHLSDDLYTSFSETGAVHVLAVSGLHVGIICMIFIFFFNRINNDSNIFKVIKLITLLSVVWIYALVTGASPAVLRAAVMFSFILVGKLWFRGTNIYNILACSALIILLYDPYLLFQLSFQFSYLALISIVFFQPHIEKLYDTKHWVFTRIWQLTTVSIAAQILIFPISVFLFHKFPTYFILSGIVAVFLATFILGMGLLLICINSVPAIGDLVSAGYSRLLEIFIQIISWIQSLPYNNIDGVYFSKVNVILLYVLIGIVMFRLSLKPKNYKEVFHKNLISKRISKLLLALGILFLLINSILFSYRIKNHSELIVYDISNATAIDIFCGNNLYTIESKNTDIKKIDFANKSYRIYNGSPNAISLSEVKECENDHFILNRNGTMIYKNKHLILMDRIDMNKIIPCTSDILLVANKSKVLPYEFLEYHITSLVVLDNSLSFKVKNQWSRECERRNIEVFDIRKKGIFRL